MTNPINRPGSKHDPKIRLRRTKPSRHRNGQRGPIRTRSTRSLSGLGGIQGLGYRCGPQCATPYGADELLAPVPNPGQIFAIGLNYRDHADEANLAHPDDLVVLFTSSPPAWPGRTSPSNCRANSSTTKPSWSSLSAAPPTGSARTGRLVDRRRGLRRAGLERAGRPAPRAGTAVQPRQVLPKLRAVRTGGRDHR